MKIDKYYSFIFRGLLTENALDKAGRNNKLVNNTSLDSEIVDRLPFEILEEECVIKAKRMATVYTAMAAFENTVRKFVFTVLLEEFSENWWEKGVSEKIRRKAETRKEEEDRIKWHSSRGDNLINYTDFNNLCSIICNNISIFEPHVYTSEWVSSILKPIEKSRNVLMHSGELPMEDVERIGTLMRDWISQVGG